MRLLLLILALLLRHCQAWMPSHLPHMAPRHQVTAPYNMRPSLRWQSAARPVQARRQELSGEGANQGTRDFQGLPSTTLTLRHKESKTEVTLVGCVHGSQASCEDVLRVFDERSPKVVVLELCESRYKHLLQDATTAKSTVVSEVDEGGGGVSKRVTELMTNLEDFRSRYGILQTMLVALLSSSAEMQRLLSSERGCEFTTGIKQAKKNRALIVLGDQDLSLTLTRFKKGWNPFKDPPSLLSELTSLRDAVVGPPRTSVSQRLNLFRVLFTEERYIKEILLIVVPLSIIVLGALEAVDLISEATLSPLTSAIPAAAEGMVSGAATGIEDAMTAVSWVAVHVFMAVYLLSINRYILVERDIILADSIKEACTKNPNTRVVAILGLLHVNGCARNLRAAGFE